MNELSFLLDLLLNHKLSKPVKDIITARVNELSSGQPPNPYKQMAIKIAPNPAANVVEPDQIAKTPEAQAALAHRAAMIKTAQSLKPQPGTDHAPKVHGKL